MSTAALISVEDYLHTSFEDGDREYVDGRIVERNVEEINDYLEFGVQYVWVVNPRTRGAYVYTSSGLHEAKDSILRTSNPEIEIPLAQMF